MSFQPPPNRVIPVVDDNRQAHPQWWEWFRTLANMFNQGFTGTVALAKITGGGTDGSLTLVNGVVTAYTAPT